MRTLARTLLVLLAAMGIAGTAAAQGSGGGTVVVINDSDFTLDIHVDGDKRFTLKPGTRRPVEGLSEGNHDFKAITADGTVKFRKELRVAAGQKLSWYLKWSRVEGKLVIENPNGVPVAVFVDDMETLGVPPTDASVYRNLAPGAHTLRLAHSHFGELTELLTVEVDIGGGEPPVVTAPMLESGSIAVRNDTDGRLRVVIDGQDMGWLEAGEDAQFQPFPVGLHRIRVMDESGQLVRHRAVEVGTFETAVLIVPSRRSSSTQPRSWAGREGARPEPGPSISTGIS